MNGEEVGVEDGGEDGLLDADFGEDGEEFGGEIEVVVEVHEPTHILLLVWIVHLSKGWGRDAYQLYEGILDPTPTVKCLIVLHGSYAPPFATASSPSFLTGSDGNNTCALKSPHR